MRIMAHRLFFVLCLMAGSAWCNNADSLKKALNGKDSKEQLDLIIKLASYFQKVNTDSAKTYGFKALEMAHRMKNMAAVANAELGLSFVFTTSGEYSDAHRHAFIAQHIADSLKDDAILSRTQGSIGYVYAKLNNQTEAIKYYRKGIKPAENISNTSLLANLYNNIGNAWLALKMNDSALWYLQQGLGIRIKTKDIQGMSYSYNNIGNVYADLKDTKKAKEYYMKSLELKRQMNDDRSIISSYNNLAYVEMEAGNNKEAISYIEKAFELSNIIHNKDYLYDAYEIGAEVYSKSGDYKKAAECYAKLREMDKKMFDEGMAKQITENQAKYESVKKENEIALLKKDQDMNLLVISKQRYVNYAVGIVLVLVLSLTFFIYRGYAQKNRSNKVLHQQKAIIETKNKDILDSINYARRIQEAVMPKTEDIRLLLHNYFIFYQPRDIVSGDFYFIEPIRTNDGQQYVAIAVADCTGHGVPGAFMSMLGYDILKNSLHDKEVNSAAEALDYLNNRLSRVLRSTSGSGQMRDGMDIAFCVLDPVSLKLYYAGANNPCWVIKKDKSVGELNPDKQPIGFFEKSAPFTLKSVQLEQGDTFYLFTDGYADQFGGPKGKKFKYKQLRQTLTDLTGKDLEHQKEILRATFESWKGHHEQIDDVTVIGVRV